MTQYLLNSQPKNHITQWNNFDLWACCTFLSVAVIAAFSIPQLQHILPLTFGPVLSFCAMIPLVTALVAALAANKCGFASVNLMVFYVWLASCIPN